MGHCTVQLNPGENKSLLSPGSVATLTPVSFPAATDCWKQSPREEATNVNHHLFLTPKSVSPVQFEMTT